MSENPTRATSDDLGLFLTWILAAVVCVCLATLFTGPAVIGAMMVFALAWFFGHDERQFPLLLTLAGPSIMIAMIFASGQGLSVALNWSHSYFIGFARSGWAGVWGTWLETFSPGRAWGLASPLGPYLLRPQFCCAMPDETRYQLYSLKRNIPSAVERLLWSACDGEWSRFIRTSRTL